MKAKKGILVIVLCAALALSVCLAGCSMDVSDIFAKVYETSEEIQGQMDALDLALANSAGEGNFRSKWIINTSRNDYTEYLINFRGDDPATNNVNETAILLQKADATFGSTAYSKFFYGASLGKGVNAKNATFDDYKVFAYVPTTVDVINGNKNKSPKETKNTYVRSSMTIEEFMGSDFGKDGQSLKFYDYGRDAMLAFAQKLVDGGVMPVKVKELGAVKTYYFELTIDDQKEYALNDGKLVKTGKKDDGTQYQYYPIILQTTKDRLSKITDDNDDPTVKLFMTYYPSNTTVPVYDADFMIDGDNGNSVILPDGYTLA